MVFPVVAGLALTGAGMGMNMMGRRSARKAEERALAERQRLVDAFTGRRDGLAEESSSQYMDLIRRLSAGPEMAQQRVGDDQAFRATAAGPAPQFAGGGAFGEVAQAQANRGANLQGKRMAAADATAPWAHMTRDSAGAMGGQVLGDQLRQALLGHESERLDTALQGVQPNLNRAFNQQAMGQLFNLAGNTAFTYGAQRAT